MNEFLETENQPDISSYSCLIEKSIDDYNKSLDNKAKQEDNGSTESKKEWPNNQRGNKYV